MEYIVEEKFPYIIMGGLPIPNSVSNFDEAKFYEKMKEAIGSDNFLSSQEPPTSQSGSRYVGKGIPR